MKPRRHSRHGMERHRDDQPVAVELGQARGDPRQHRRQRDALAVLERQHELARGVVVERAGGNAVVARRIGEARGADRAFGHRCPACGEGIAAQDGLCAACWAELAIPGEPACAQVPAAVRRRQRRPGAVCAPCLADPPRHDGIAAGTLYNDASRQLVLAFKHGKRSRWRRCWRG